MEDAGQRQCVGKLEILKPKPVGFLCGTLPVPTDSTFLPSHSAIIPSPNSIGAPRYQMLPAETDLNTLPLLSGLPERGFPAASKATEGLQSDNGARCQNLFRKCESLAVCGLTEYGNEVDVVAPTDILKLIFKIPYSKAQLSIAVQRIGDTLILNAGPNVEDEEKHFRRHNSQSKCSDPSIFLNFAMHSVRAEACDCPPSYQPSSDDQAASHRLPGNFGFMKDSCVTSTTTHCNKSQVLDQKSTGGRKPSQSNSDKYFWDNKVNARNNRRADSVKRTQIGENPSHPMQDSEQSRRLGNNGFLRVLFWQFHNFRMLLGSDMLLFSNDKYVAVSLHLWDVSRQVTPLTWLEAWLDNVMASVPELAICYHQNGVVQGYELLKTDDIFLLKGVSEDGIPAFQPQVVQQNGLSVLRFLQENCKQDPGAYWLYKGAGEDVIQLFDLSVLPKNHPDDDAPGPLSSLMQKGRKETLFSLGTLLYRIAHRLSLSKAPSNRIKCAMFFKKCLDFLHDQDHMVVRAYAHEQFARLILKCYEELELASDTSLLEYEVRIANLEEESSEFSFPVIRSTEQGTGLSQVFEDTAAKDGNIFTSASIDASVLLNLEAHSQNPQSIANSTMNDVLDMHQTSTTSPSLVKTVVDPISSKLAAVHHVSQAIKSLRWKRQLQNAQGDLVEHGNRFNERLATINLSLCACGDVNCIEICDIREWLTKAKMDHKMWNLVLLLGESYLALGVAYKEDGQLYRALKVVKLACLVYGSMPQHLDDAQFISSMDTEESYQLKLKEGDGTPKFSRDGKEDIDFNMYTEGYLSEHFSPKCTYLFWPKAWALVGDVYVEYQRMKDKEVKEKEDDRTSGSEVRVSNVVAREVMRLKKKLGQYKQNCISCSLINCSCQNDRASSGSSASSSRGNALPSYSRKHNKKSNLRASITHSGNINDYNTSQKSDYGNASENERHVNNNEEYKHEFPAKASNIISHVGGYMDNGNALGNNCTPKQTVCSGSTIKDSSNAGTGGIFRFLESPNTDNVEHNLSTAIYCYNAAWKAMKGFSLDSEEFISVLKKKGWVSNELGRYRLNNNDLVSAEIAFADAIQAFKEISDHINIILIYCNLGHGRRSLAEELVSKLDELIDCDVLKNPHKQAIEAAKLEYFESLKHYGAAKLELDSINGTVDTSVYNEVCTQFAHTYLRLGMLLAKETISDEAYKSPYSKDSVNVRTKEQQKNTISASSALMEAVSMYESLGTVRKQEAAFTHFQLASFHKGNCLKLLDLEPKQFKLLKRENKHQKAKWYASLADKHWKKALDFYGPMTHSVMYLNILLEQAAFSFHLSNSFHSNVMLEEALLHLLDGRHIVEMGKDCEIDKDLQIKLKFWSQLQSLLKSMLMSTNSRGSNKSSVPSLPVGRVWDSGKLREMYRTSLKSSSFSQLHDMYNLWFH